MFESIYRPIRDRYVARARRLQQRAMQQVAYWLKRRRRLKQQRASQGSASSGGPIILKSWWKRQWPHLNFRPLGAWMPQYNNSKLRADFFAGLNVALLAFPQGIAFAALAGVPIKYGIYCAAIAPMVAALWSHSACMAIGPTNTTAITLLSCLMTLPPQVSRPDAISLLVLMVGMTLLAASLLRVSRFMRFISRTVLLGYTVAAVALIVVHELDDLLGLGSVGGTTFWDTCRRTLAVLPNLQWVDLALATITGLLFWHLRRRFPKIPQAVLVLSFVSLLTAWLGHWGVRPALMESTQLSEMPWTFPALDLTWFGLLSGSALAIAMVASLETLFVTQAVRRNPETPNLDQDIFALGAANVACSVSSGMPASVSLNRSSMNAASGAMTPLTGFFAGGFCIAAAPLLILAVEWIPRSAMAALIVLSCFGLLNRQLLRVGFSTSRDDSSVLIITIIAGLLVPLNVAIFLGVTVSILMYLRQSSYPMMAEYVVDPEVGLQPLAVGGQRPDARVAIVHVQGDLFFGSAGFLDRQLRQLARAPDVRVLIVRLKDARMLDATSIMSLMELHQELARNGRHLILSGVSRAAQRVLHRSGALDVLGAENVFGAAHAPAISTKQAVVRAQTLLGQEQLQLEVW